MVADCIRLSTNDVISTPELKQDLESRFGLRFPESALEIILRRLRKRNYLRVENNIYYRNIANLSSLTFHETQQKILVMHDALINKMVEFCNKKFAFVCTTEEAEKSLLAFLKENALLIMSAVTTGTLIPDITPASKSGKYYVAKFINHLQHTKSAELDYLEKVIEGNMLANAIFLPDPMRAGGRFHRTKLFFDTTFLIYALGYAGKPRQDPCAELLEMLYETGADLRCFPHTVDEIVGILNSCARRMRSGEQSDPFGTVDYFIEKEYTDSDIQLLIDNLPKSLNSIRIQIEEKPLYTSEYVIGEDMFGEALESEIHYLNPDAKIRDVDSISAIMRFRHLHEYYFVEECRALFTTTNSKLAKVSRAFFYKGTSERVVSPCITDSSLTTLLWLKKPLKMPDLPMRRIIADCYASLQPDMQLIQAYLNKVQQIEQRSEITADEVLMLRYSLEAKQSLMDLTCGDEEVFGHVTIHEILELAKERMQSKMRGELQAKANIEIQKVQTKLHRASTRLAQKGQQLIQAEGTIDELKISSQIRETNITLRANKIARFFGLAFKASLIPIIVIGMVFSLPWHLPSIFQSPTRYVMPTILSILFILVVVNLVNGTTINSIARNIEKKCSNVIANLLKSITA
ncbi:hypothetical protein ACFLWB_02120 [Chloroflexota bacterium]